MNKKTLQNYIQEIDAVRYRDAQRMLKLSRKMVNEAKADKDEKASAYAEYFFLEARYRTGTLNEKMLNRAVRALQLCRKCKLYELEVKCNNMIGIFFLNHGDNMSALEYYQVAIDVANRHHFKRMSRVLTNNIGDLYIQMKQYDTALVYLEKCLKQSRESCAAEKRKEVRDEVALNMNICLLNMAECSYLLGNYEEALEQINSMYELDNGDEYYGAARDAQLVICHAALGRISEVEDKIEATIYGAEKGNDRIEAVKEYVRVCQVLIHENRIEQAERMYRAIRTITEELNFAKLWCDYYETAILLAKKKQDNEALIQAYENYVETKKRWDEFQNNQQVKALKNRQALNAALKKQKRAELEKVSLKKLSEHDALTGLYNRYVLNRECEKWCRIAQEQYSNIGVIVMDIDYFKQYNDTYGHLLGDQALKQVGAALMEAVGNKGIVVRYGGDEFFVLTHHLEMEDMIQIAKDINVSIRKKEVCHEMSRVSRYLTLSQGVVNGVPEEGQSVIDFIHLADNALYKAKEVKRSSIGIYENGHNRVIANETLE